MSKAKRGDVEIWTDAGHRGGRGAWACVAIRPGGDAPPFEASGPLKLEINNSSLHELQAIANGIHTAARAGLVRRGDLVLIRSDNLAAVHTIQQWKTPTKKAAKVARADVVKWVGRFIADNGVTVTARHVKGHQPLHSTDPHAANNRRCDQLCGIVLGDKPPKAARPAPQPSAPRLSRYRNVLAAVAKLQGERL